MFYKSFESISYSDIEDLVVTRKERESINLDYKKILEYNDNARIELAKDVTAFANSAGGWMIIGVDEKTNEIAGVEKAINAQKAEDWLSNVIVSNTDPIISPRIKLIDIPGSEKAVILIHAEESANKPHMVKKKNQYYVRHNTTNDPANHFEVRDMFEYSKNRQNDIKEFLSGRNLYDIKSPNFGKNRLTEGLQNDSFTKEGLPKPLAIFSVIPVNLTTEKILGNTRDFMMSLDEIAKGHYPLKNFSLQAFDIHKAETNLDGICFPSSKYGLGLTSYCEIMNNGYIEFGFSQSLIFVWNDGTQKIKLINVNNTVGFYMKLLGFAKKLMNHIKYDGEVIYQVSFVNVLNIQAEGFGHNVQLRRVFESPTNKSHNNFLLQERLLLSSLSDDDIIQLGKDFSGKLARAFGMSTDYVFKGGSFDENEFGHFF
jgi:hypothetical protein